MRNIISEEQARAMVTDAAKNKMNGYAIGEKYGIDKSIACYVAKYSKLGYELADEKSVPAMRDAAR